MQQRVHTPITLPLHVDKEDHVSTTVQYSEVKGSGTGHPALVFKSYLLLKKVALVCTSQGLFPLCTRYSNPEKNQNLKSDVS